MESIAMLIHKKLRGLLGAFVLLFFMLTLPGAAACSRGTQETAGDTIAPEQNLSASDIGEDDPAAKKTGDIMILFTSDVHCGVDQGFGYAGLEQIRRSFESQGYETILVDNGDSVQGETMGMLTKGEANIELMNSMRYDAAIPGNHEFDYGMEQFLKLADMAEFPYISCNFNKEGKLVFDPYTMIEAAGRKIAFIGVTTPTTIVSSTPSFFKDDNGEFIYGFWQDDTGEGVIKAVQNAADSARAEGADLVYVMAHLGMAEEARPWTYADIIANTNGIDVLFDGHSHDTEQVVMKNKDGYDVVRTACGTKLESIGYSHISPDGRIVDTGIWTWTNSISAPELLGISNDMSSAVELKYAEFEEILSEKIGETPFELTINDPEAVDLSGTPVRMIRRAETNSGDLLADAFRARTGADIAVMSGGGIRTSIARGEITLGDVYRVQPFGNKVCVIEATGQQLLDALEWGSRAVPDENGAFLQVSGLTYEIHTYIKSGCRSDANSMMTGISGERRVKNVLIGGEPIDPGKTYTVAGTDYTLLENGDGYTAFGGAKLVSDDFGFDYQILCDYISEDMNGVVDERYSDPYGQGRITIMESR